MIHQISGLIYTFQARYSLLICILLLSWCHVLPCLSVCFCPTLAFYYSWILWISPQMCKSATLPVNTLWWRNRILQVNQKKCSEKETVQSGVWADSATLPRQQNKTAVFIDHFLLCGWMCSKEPPTLTHTVSLNLSQSVGTPPALDQTHYKC